MCRKLVNMKDKQSKKDYLYNLFLLKTFYPRIIQIFDSMKSGFVMYDDLSLNQIYISLTEKIDNILNQKEFSDLKKDSPEIYDNLLGISEELDHSWEFLKSDLLYFFGKIEKRCIINKVKEYKLPKETENFIKSVDFAISKHAEKVKKGTNEFCKEVKKLSKDNSKKGTKNQKVEFLEDKSSLVMNDKECQLPPFKNEYFFCVAAYQYPVGEVIDWSKIYETMTGYYAIHFGKPIEKRENWRSVYDTVIRLNERVENVLGIKNLFVWREKTIKRNY